jgi:tryptophan synthase alpha chain
VSRIESAFRLARESGRTALVAYIMAGDPDLRTTEGLALACERGGADILEVGIPFSDPIADGPEIQGAAQRALRAGTTPRDALRAVSRIRQSSDMPLVLMTYLNPVLAMGEEAFADQALGVGADGVIVPDLSFEESPALASSLKARGLDLVQLVAPSTPEARARAIGLASRGFLYVVARYGTTGTRADVPEELLARLPELKKTTPLPLAVGFGMSTPEQVRALRSAGADGVVVGSAIVRLAARDPSPAAAVERFVMDLALGARAPALQGNSS